MPHVIRLKKFLCFQVDTMLPRFLVQRLHILLNYGGGGRGCLVTAFPRPARPANNALTWFSFSPLTFLLLVLSPGGPALLSAVCDAMFCGAV